MSFEQNTVRVVSIPTFEKKITTNIQQLEESQRVIVDQAIKLFRQYSELYPTQIEVTFDGKIFTKSTDLRAYCENILKRYVKVPDYALVSPQNSNEYSKAFYKVISNKLIN